MDNKIIDSYTREDALKDGVIFELGKHGDTRIYVTSNCYHIAGLNNKVNRLEVIMEAVTALSKANSSDYDDYKFRELHRGIEALWVIWDGEAITIMIPTDY